MKALLCCEKKKPMLRIAKEEMKNQNRARCYSKEETKYFTQYIEEEMYEANGKIVAECDFEVEKIEKEYGTHHVSFNEEGYFDDYYDYMTKTIDEDILLKRSCLNVEELENYNPNYAIHIKNLHIFDEPKELSDYIIKQCQFAKCSTCKYGKNNIICSTIDTPITKAPRNMMYVYDNEEKKILIPITSEEMCRIANGEQNIIIRRTILKEIKL